MANVRELLLSADRWRTSFDKPLSLGAATRLSIVTCMDSRVLPEIMFNLGVGDAEIIRNAGGRVTMDVIRSLTVAQEIVPPGSRTIFVIHHTDCGGQAAVKRHNEFIDVLQHNLGISPIPLLGSLLQLLLKVFDMTGLIKLLLKPIKPTQEGLVQSVVDDVNILKGHPLITGDVDLYGFVYSTEDGSLKQIIHRPPGSLGRARHVHN